MKAILSFSLLLLFCLPTMAQVDSTAAKVNTEKVLIIKHRAGERKPRILKQGKVVKLFMYGGEMVVKGRFKLEGDFIIINDNAYALKDIDYLRVSPRATKITGGVLTGVGGGVVLTGTVVTGQAINDDDACGVLGGIILMTIGLVPTVIGVPLLFVGKKYDLRQKWEISASDITAR